MMLRFQASPHPTIPSGPLRSGAGLPRCHVAIPLHVRGARCGRRRMGVRASMRSGEEPERWDGEFLQASLLVPETVRHYNLLRQGFLEETKWHSSGQMDPHCAKQKGPSSNANSVGYEFLDSFHNPTIFLKISCDCDLLLPIVVGDSAMERFLESLTNNRKEVILCNCVAVSGGIRLHSDYCIQGHPSQLQFIQKLVEVLGHEVKMVQITKRVVTTYYADIILGKPAEMAYVSVDSRPSDAICVANMFKVPIFVSKDVVLKDAIRIISGTWRKNGAKRVYDVFLDSAIEGADYLSEELGFLRKMNIAIDEERYQDAVIWREKLTNIRMRKQGS